MKKIINAIIFSITIFFTLFSGTITVNANSISNIDMDIYIDSNGNAHVTETWQVNLKEGTEGYRVYSHMNDSEIYNFTVMDETGRKYETLSSWDVNADFKSKAYKCGINYTSNKLELCWGISKYGDKTYTLQYDISNFVTQYTDNQGIYFNLISLDEYVDNAKITIHSDQKFSIDNSKIWAFGNDGTINFQDGNIVLDSEGALPSYEYMVALIKFESNMFSVNNNSSKSFESIYNSEVNAINISKSKDPLPFPDFTKMKEEDFVDRYMGHVIVIFFIIFSVMFVSGNKKTGSRNKGDGQLNFGKEGKRLPSNDEIPYWRDIPCKKDLQRAYWIAYQYNIVNKETLKEGIIGAILLNWIKIDKIGVLEVERGLFDFKDNNYAIDFNKMQMGITESEDELLKMLKEAAGSNGILEGKEFERWCRRNYQKVESWFENFLWVEEAKLEAEEIITISYKEVKNFFGRKKTIIVKDVNPMLLEEAVELKGFQKFLIDFSIMPEREYMEVHIWEEYLIFAELLGIADKVQEQFSRLYPNFNQLSNVNTQRTLVAVRRMAHSGCNGVRLGRQNYSSSTRRSHGGGGKSFRSGGSSSRGSSGGGFR